MLLTLADLGSSRMNRVLLVMLGLVIYALFCLGLVRYGYLQVTGWAFVPLLGVWIVGLLGLMFADETRGRFDAGTLTFSKALWCNLGVVVTAVLVPHSIRLLLLVVPLLGVVYAALHLNRKQMLSIGLVTWLAYVASAMVLASYTESDPNFEGLLGLAFTCMLAGMMFMASEVTTLRVAFDRRRNALNQAMEQLAELAMLDELTGLYNRRYIMDVLARQKGLADRGHASFTLCYCDLDHFKQINDRYGHQVGDRVLSDFARVAEAAVRSVDYVARLGGEEFLLVLIGADEQTATGVAERLSEGSRSVLIDPENPEFRLSVSIGIASFRPDERVEDVIQRSDQALYSAKSLGRDRVVVGT